MKRPEMSRAAKEKLAAFKRLAGGSCVGCRPFKALINKLRKK